jgi:hypothetical protein
MSIQAARGTLRSAVTGAAALAAFLATTAATMSAAQAKGLDVCTMYASTDTNVTTDVKKKLDDTKLFNSVTNIDAGNSAPSAATLAACDAILVYADLSRGGFSDPNGTGNALASYVDQGGGVVMVNPYYAGNSYNNVYSSNWDKYILIETGGMTFVSKSSLGMADMTHPIMNGVTKVETSGSRCYQRSGATGSAIRTGPATGGKVVATWTDGNAMVVVGTPNGKQRVDLNLYAVSSDAGSSGCYDSTSDVARLIANALLFVANPLKVSVQPLDFGAVPMGSLSAPLSVDVTNTGTDTLTLTGAVLAPTTVFTVSGATYPKTLNPGEKLTLNVTAQPTASGRQTATYTITQSAMGAPPTVVNLTVNGLGPQFDIQPPSIEFGGVLTGKSAAPVTVTITNTGGGFLVLNPTPAVSDTTNFGLNNVPTTLPMLIGAGGSVSFDVKFTPPMEQQYSGTLKVPYSINGSTNNGSVALHGSYGKPKIQVPPAVVLSPVRVTQMGPPQNLAVTNAGLADLTIASLTFSGGDAGDFAVVSMPPIKIGPNGAMGSVQIQCNPSMTGIRQSTLSINSDDPMTPTATMAVQCKGTVANFNMQPDKLDFTATPQQTGTCSASQNVTITNSGSDALHILSVTTTGTNPDAFKFTLPGGAKLVPANGTYAITVQFCPKTIGNAAASLTIATDLMAGHTAQVPLTGVGTGPQVQVMPGNLDFGAVYIKTTSMSQKIHIKNLGDQPLIFGKSAVTPAMPGGPFTVAGLPAEGTKLLSTDPDVVLTITASPLQAMQQTGEIDIAVNDQVKMGMLKIPLAVTGIQASLMVSPMTLSFPVTIIGESSMPQTVTVTNTGAAPLTGLTLSVSGNNPTDFLTMGALPASIAPGQTGTFQVAFKPTADGSRSGIVVLNAAGLMAPTQIKTDGIGKLLTLDCTPSDKDLGRVVQGSESSVKIVCTNSDPGAIDYVASFSDNMDDWSVDAPTGNLAGSTNGQDGVLQLNVTFKPTGTGPRTTTLTIKTKDGIAIATINLDGTGGAMPKAPGGGDMGGCAYAGTQRVPATAWLLLLLGLGTLLVRRRRYSL